MGGTLPKPLKNKTKDGSLYNRQPEIEAGIETLEGIESSKRIQLFQEPDKSHQDYVPSEMLVYFLRRAWRQGKKNEFEQIFKLLIQRIEVTLRNKIPNADIERASEVRDEIIARFAELIARDCNNQSTILDYYEVRFNHAFAAFRKTTLRDIGPVADNTERLTINNGDVEEIKPEVESSVNNLPDQFSAKLDDLSFRSSLMAAINNLPEDQKVVVGLILQEIPIDSKKKGVITIASILNCDERTVRNRRDRAYKALKEALREEWEQ